MLAIKRKVGEVVWIGDAKVTIYEVIGRSVRLAIDAPLSVLILRDELRQPVDLTVVDSPESGGGK